MSELGGTGTACCAVALTLSLLLVAAVAACPYEGDVDVQPPPAEASRRGAPSLPTKDPEVLGTEGSNYAELSKRLVGAPGSVLLDDSGPADGPGVGFQQNATVKASGTHAVTASCVGTESAQIILYQEAGSGSELSLELDCSQILSQAVELHKGFVGAQLTGVTRPVRGQVQWPEYGSPRAGADDPAKSRATGR